MDEERSGKLPAYWGKNDWKEEDLATGIESLIDLRFLVTPTDTDDGFIDCQPLRITDLIYVHKSMTVYPKEKHITLRTKMLEMAAAGLEEHCHSVHGANYQDVYEQLNKKNVVVSTAPVNTIEGSTDYTMKDNLNSSIYVCHIIEKYLLKAQTEDPRKLPFIIQFDLINPVGTKRDREPMRIHLAVPGNRFT